MTRGTTPQAGTIDPTRPSVRTLSVNGPGTGGAGEDPRFCLPARSGVSVGLRLASVIAGSRTRDGAVSAITSLLAAETAGPVAAWRVSPSRDALIFVAAAGLPTAARRHVVSTSSPWPGTGGPAIAALVRAFASIAGSADPTVVDLRVAVLVLAERCPEIEASRQELADAIAALPAVSDVVVVDRAAEPLDSGRLPKHDEAIRRLTPRELEILELISTGLGTNQIADVLVISAKTVKTHAQNILTKLGVGSRLEAAAVFLGSAKLSAEPASRRR